MTLNDLLDFLKAHDPQSPLVFKTQGGDIGSGYHVTELKRATVRSIDCGGRESSWIETSVQLLDGRGGSHMRVGKFIDILDRSVKQIDHLGDADARVEFSLGNDGLRLFEITRPQATDEGVSIRLNDASATCKILQARDFTSVANTCCGGKAPKPDGDSGHTS